MTSNFIHDFGGCRLDWYDPQPVMEDGANDDDEQGEKVDLSYEGIAPEHWQALDAAVPADWQPHDWPERPVRFIDGKDVGDTVAWVRAPGGYPVPIRLGQIGSIVMDVVDQSCRRAYYTSEPVVSLVTQPFPWEAVESFGVDLQKHGFRLLSALPPLDESVTPAVRRCSYDFEKMRKAAQNRCTDEMTVLEQAAIAQLAQIPTVVDGRLEPRRGGFTSDTSPIYGVIKTHQKTYLHPRGMQVLYALEHGQRTPLFRIDRYNRNTPPVVTWSVVTWYVRLGQASHSMPNYGLIRVEVPTAWFEAQHHDAQFVNRLTRLLCRYRCRQESYGRAAISLHPIVRAEESLGACFRHTGRLVSSFCRIFDL
jgi:hypothetical protein